MKYILSIIAGAILAFSVSAAELSQAALQGDWVVTEFMGKPDPEKDKWQFENDQFYQNLEGRRLPPDAFAVAPGVIDLGYAKISVTSFDGKVMHAVMGGFKYTLVKE